MQDEEAWRPDDHSGGGGTFGLPAQGKERQMTEMRKVSSQL